MILSELELCPTCKKGKLRTTEEGTGELVCDYCGQKCSDVGLNECLVISKLKYPLNTDLGPIQIGDRFHTRVIGKELYPPEGSECEKRLIKNLDKPNSLAAR